MFINKKRKNAFLIFISGHGYGHISRMSHVLRSLYAKCEILDFSSLPYFIVVSASNPQFFSNLHLKNTMQIHLSHDVGLIQHDSFNVDFKSTLFELKQIEINREIIKAKIFKQIEDFNIVSVLSDTSPFAFSVAKELNVPSILLGNFTWVDIYKDIAEIEPLFQCFVENLEKEYLKADKCLALPMHTKMEPFSEKIDIPFIAPKESVMEESDWEKVTKSKILDKRKKILLSFGGFDFDKLPVLELKKYSEKYLFLTTRAKGYESSDNLINIDSLCRDYQGLIKFSDAIITKPGYGIIADCLVHKKPIIYTDRGRFAEYPVLAKWLDDNFPSVYLSQKDLINGALTEVLEEIFCKSLRFPEILTNGADIVAENLINLSRI